MVRLFSIFALLFSTSAFGQPTYWPPLLPAPQWVDPWRNPPNSLSPSGEFFQGVKRSWERYEIPAQSPGGRPYAPSAISNPGGSDQG